jgi:hypothetical protein
MTERSEKCERNKARRNQERKMERCAESALINDDGLLVLIFIIIFVSPQPTLLIHYNRGKVARGGQSLFIYFP